MSHLALKWCIYKCKRNKNDNQNIGGFYYEKRIIKGINRRANQKGRNM